MKLPVFRSLSDPKLPGDLVAGLTVWAVLVPEALAYASIAGVSPVVGLYAAPGALILYAAFGSSRQLIIGPGAATAALSAAIVGDLATQGASDYVQLTATLAITVGLLAIAVSLLRLQSGVSQLRCRSRPCGHAGNDTMGTGILALPSPRQKHQTDSRTSRPEIILDG